ncbi:MAG: hypothetical protein OEY58_20495, partial [Gammaproteobacteria bacterium]|nr:hypothetical protein [Gammaproteobacteria bacterium]
MRHLIKTITLNFQALLLLGLLCQPAVADVELPRGEYHETTTDLQVKVLGGAIKLQRTWYGGRWHFSRPWNPLVFEISTLDASVKSITLNDDVYTRSADGNTYIFDERHTISVTAGGYRYQDRDANWVEYDNTGKPTRYGDRRNLYVHFIYDPVITNRLIGVSDHNSAQVLWIEYNTDNQLISARDHLDPVQSRQVTYNYTGDYLTQVIDVLGNAWLYSYTDTIASQQKTITHADPTVPAATYGYTPNVSRTTLLSTKTDPDGRITTIGYDVAKRAASVKRADASGINYIYDYDKTKKQYYTRRTYSSGKILEHWYDSEGE